MGCYFQWLGELSKFGQMNQFKTVTSNCFKKLWGRTGLGQPVKSGHIGEVKLTDCIQTNSAKNITTIMLSTTQRLKAAYFFTTLPVVLSILYWDIVPSKM